MGTRGREPFNRPPKEQPPRNLSGKRDRAGRIDTLESVLAQAGATEGVSRIAVRRAVKALRFRDRGGGGLRRKMALWCAVDL